MNRQQKHFAIFLFIVIVCQVQAVGLGELEIRSRLGQVLDAEMPLRGVDANTQLEDIRPLIASPELHLKNGIVNNHAQHNIQLKLIEDEQNGIKLKLTSRLPIKEPIVQFLVDLQWQTGRLLKETVILLDPPAYQPVETKTPEIPTAKPVTENRLLAVYQDGVYGPVQYGETLYSIASKFRPKGREISLNTMMQTIVSKNPRAFLNGRIDGLMQGYKLSIPTLEELTTVKPETETVPTPLNELTNIGSLAVDKPAEISIQSLLQNVLSLKDNLLLRLTGRLNPEQAAMIATTAATTPSLQLSMSESLSAQSLELMSTLYPPPEPEALSAAAEEIFDEAELVEAEIKTAIDDTEVAESNEEILEIDESIIEPAAQTITNLMQTEQSQPAVQAGLTSVISSLKNKQYQTPLLGLLAIGLLWFTWTKIKTRQRQESEQDILLDAIAAEKTEFLSMDDEPDHENDVEQTVVPEPEPEPIQAEPQLEDNLAEATAENREETVTPAVNENEEKLTDENTALEMVDTFSDGDIVIDEDDYEDLLDITSNKADVEVSNEESISQKIEDEPLTLDMDLYSENTDEESAEESEFRQFEQEVNLLLAYGDFEAARKKIDAVLANEPDNINYKFLLLNLLNMNNDKQAANNLAAELKETETLPKAMRIKVDTVIRELSNGQSSHLIH